MRPRSASTHSASRLPVHRFLTCSYATAHVRDPALGRVWTFGPLNMLIEKFVQVLPEQHDYHDGDTAYAWSLTTPSMRQPVDGSTLEPSTRSSTTPAAIHPLNLIHPVVDTAQRSPVQPNRAEGQHARPFPSPPVQTLALGAYGGGTPTFTLVFFLLQDELPKPIW